MDLLPTLAGGALAGILGLAAALVLIPAPTPPTPRPTRVLLATHEHERLAARVATLLAADTPTGRHRADQPRPVLAAPQGPPRRVT